MARPIASSKELNEKMAQADKMIEDINQEIADIKEDVAKKMQVLRNDQQYAEKLAGELKEFIEGGHYSPSQGAAKIVFSADRNLYGEYDIYGNTIHGKFIRSPRNLFNIETTSGPLFRSNVITMIGEEESPELKSALMLDGAKGKSIFFEEFTDNEVTLTIEVDRSKILGDTHFNIIEINPYLEGSFDIEHLRIWEMHKQSDTSLELTGLKEIGKSRIVLDKKYELFAIEIKVKINYRNSSGKYPFGLETLQFLNGDFKDDSYVVMKVSKPDFIEYVGDDILLKEHTGTTESTFSDEDIMAYIDFEDGVLSGEVAISTDDVLYPIARNTKHLHLYMPIRRALKSLTIKTVSTR